MEGSFCCGLRNGLGSDVDVSVLKNGESRRLATTTELYMDVLARRADDNVLIMQMEGARCVERIRERRGLRVQGGSSSATYTNRRAAAVMALPTCLGIQTLEQCQGLAA